VSYRFSPITIRIPMTFFTEIEKNIPKIHMERHILTKAILRKKEK
jgi:hypothetical protein